MQDNLADFQERVNRAAFERFSQRLHDQKQKLSIEETIRQGDIERQREAQWLIDNGYLPHTRITAKNTPTGFYRFKERARSEATQRGDAEAKTPTSYLYETPEKTPLVNHAKSQSRFLTSIDQETGEIQELTIGKDGELLQAFDARVYRAEKYALQAEARHILKGIVRRTEKTDIHPVYRVCNCLRSAYSAESVTIVKTQSTDSLRYAGLQTCGSIWHCPICAARISEHRASEVRYMLDMWQASGKGVLFITNTIRHGYDDDIRLVLDVLFGTAWNRYINHRKMKKLRKELGYLGRVRAVEVTHGQNGWHPHVHEVWLIERKLSFKEMLEVKKTLYEIWNTTLTGAGLRAVSKLRGVTVQPGSNAAEYLAKYGRMPKWDTGKEMTKAHIKNGKKSSTPFDLLRRSLLGDETASRLFKEYAIAFSGRRQLYFSTGLKDYFCIRERTDIEISASNEDITTVLGQLTRDEWRSILVNGSRSTLLSIAESGGMEAVKLYLSSLQNLKMM